MNRSRSKVIFTPVLIAVAALCLFWACADGDDDDDFPWEETQQTHPALMGPGIPGKTILNDPKQRRVEEYQRELLAEWHAGDPEDTNHDGKISFENLPKKHVGKDRFFPDAILDSALSGNVLIETTYSNYVSFSPTEWFGLLIAHFQGLGFNVSTTDSFSNLLTYDLVILKTPRYMNASDVNLVRTFLDSGGIVWIFGEYYPDANLGTNDLLSGLNAGIHLNATNGPACEPINYYSIPTWPVFQDFTTHCLNDSLTQALHLAVSFAEIVNPAQVLYYSTESSYLRDNPSITGPFPIAVLPDPTVHPNWKLVVVGDTNVFASYSGNDYLHMYDNAQMATNWALWCQQCQIDADCDDGLFCNGDEFCNEDTDTCNHSEDPCGDDGAFCNGDESCNETTDECDSSGDPCEPWELCDEENDTCLTTTTTSTTTIEPPTTTTQEPATTTITSTTSTSTSTTTFPTDDDNADDDSIESDIPVGDKDDGDAWPEGKVTGGCYGCGG